MYVRKGKSGKTTFFQIGEKVKGRFVLIKHVGSASTPEQIEILRLKASEELNQMKMGKQTPLFPVSNTRAKLINWRITGFHQIFGRIYDSIGFPKSLLRDLVIARIAYPKSKLGTVRYLDQYLGTKLAIDSVYRFLDTLNKDALTKIAFDFVSKKNNGIALIFYDVTTLYFESNDEDDLRKKGYSKDHKNDLPQIVIGLFVDKDGYPFDFGFYDGGTFEGHTFPKAIKELTRKYKFADLVVVADAGMLSDKNIKFLETERLRYIVGARLKSLSEKFKKRIFVHDFTKEDIFVTTDKTRLDTGEVRSKKLIVDFSNKRAQKDKFNREKLIRKLEAKIASKKTLIKKSKYLLLKNQGTVAGIDQVKVELDKRHDGLKGYWTNLTDNTIKPIEIIDQYHNLWKVEKAFRMSKSDLAERPIFHRRERRIGAHLIICFCSLLIMKEFERILKPKEISLLRAIELLGKVGQGDMLLGKFTLPIDSELSEEAQIIFREVLGH